MDEFDQHDTLLPQRNSHEKVAASTKPFGKIRLRRKQVVSARTKDSRRLFPPQSSELLPLRQIENPIACNSLIVSEALKLAYSKGLRGGYIEYLRSNTDESIRRSFEEVKKELTNKQSFSRTASRVMRYLQASRILYNRLDWRKRRKYEYAARNRVRMEHVRKCVSREDSMDHEALLFVNNPADLSNDIVGAEACVMPPSEFIFMDRRSKDDSIRYNALLSRKIHCPLCPVSAEKLVNAVQYQLHMLEYHSCAHLYACNFCGMVFSSLEALKVHDACSEFAVSLKHITSSGELELTMKFAIMVMACTDCGSQLPISSSYIGGSSIQNWNDIIDFHQSHNSEKLVPLVIYSETQLSHKLRLRINTVALIGEGIEILCSHCGKSDFENVESLEYHLLSHEECNKKRCPVCSKQFSQEGFYRMHLLSHLEAKCCYLALYLSHLCTFITGGVPSCGPSLPVGSSGPIFGGVSSAIFPSKLSKAYVDPWESVTVRKKKNRDERKRQCGSSYKMDPDEVEVEEFACDLNNLNLREFPVIDSASRAFLKANGFFYTAINSNEETEYSLKLYNSNNECKCVLEEHEHGSGSKLAVDIVQKFSRKCRLFGRKSLSRKYNLVHTGLLSKILMCRRCHCLCTGEFSMYSHLSRCCPELRNVEGASAPYDLDGGSLVLCVFAGNGIPNSRIKCWECLSTLCSIFGLRVHMIVHHGIFLKTEKTSGDFLKGPASSTSTTRDINLSVGLTSDGCLPVNLEGTTASTFSNNKFENEAEMASLVIPNTATPSPKVLDYIEPPSVQVVESMNRISSAKITTLSNNYAESTPDDECQDTEAEMASMVIPDTITPLSVQVPDYIEPPSVQIVESMNQILPAKITTLSSSGKSKQDKVTNSYMTHRDVFYTEADLLDEVNRSTDPTSSECHQGSSRALCDEATLTSAQLCNDSSEHSLECEFCCLTLRSSAALRAHWKLHVEIPTSCLLCDPPFLSLDTTEMFLEHIHATHTSRMDFYKQVRNIYAKCNFCYFPIRRSRVTAHLLFECYMAPCLLCGDKLVRRNERIVHRKSHDGLMDRFLCQCRRGFATFPAFSEHVCRNKFVAVVTCETCNVKFTGLISSRSKTLSAGIGHYIQNHTSGLNCSSCNNGPLDSLREHVLIHLKESTEVVTPNAALLRCSQVELLRGTVEEVLTPNALKKKKKKRTDGCRLEHDVNEFTNPSKSNLAVPATVENVFANDDASQIDSLQSGDQFRATESNSSRDEASPSLSEKQCRVLVNSIDDLVPPPSVTIIENEAPVVREEEETPCVVPKTSVVDDGEGEILVIDEMSQHPASSVYVAPIVRTINEGNEECMVLDIVELPSGVSPHIVAASREKKFKCSMCSKAFLREASCRHHEQNTHRNDIVSDLYNEIYGVPLGEESLMYICQQCSVAFEDPERARRHLAQHMVKGPAFPCEKCSSICLTESNLREHRKKHEIGKLSYRCLKCTPNKTCHDETAIYYHLHMEHGVPIIAFCKNCLVGSANMDRIFRHIVYSECAGAAAAPECSNQHISVSTILRSLGFVVASNLHFQPNDEKQYKQAMAVKGRFAVPTHCSHRSFIMFGDAFTTCPEDPTKCFALVNQNRWHSYLCATNREAPGEMPSVYPEAVVMNVYAENFIHMLNSRFTNSERKSQRCAQLCSDSVPSTSSSGAVEVAFTSQPLLINQRQQTNSFSCVVTSRSSHSSFMQSRAKQDVSLPLYIGSQQGVCLFCRSRNVPMVLETADGAYKAVNELCIKLRDVHPIAAQTLFSTMNSFIRGAASRRSGDCFFCFCRWHYLAEYLDRNGRLATHALPCQINVQLLVDNYHNGLVYPDPCCIAPGPVSSLLTHAVRAPVNLLPTVIMKRCIVCDKLPSSGSCNAMNVNYMIAMPTSSSTLKEQWATNICRFLSGPTSQELLVAFRMQERPRLCLRHFNPRSLIMDSSGALTRSSALNDLPVPNFAQYATLNAEFCQAFGKLLDAVEKNQNSNTIAVMLKIVQELVKCSDESCGRAINSVNDVRFHRFHRLQHKYVCTECFSTADVIRSEQEMIEHFVLIHSQRSVERTNVSVIYILHCPLKNCSAVHSSIRDFRKHINHAHNGIFPLASDNCPTRFYSTAKMSFHNEIHERHSCDVTCCYLCGIVDPWQREMASGVRISHELVHAMKRFVVCKTCMTPIEQDTTGHMLTDHFMREHMVDQPNRTRHCKVCRTNVMEPGLTEHVLEQHRLVAFRPRFTPQWNAIAVMNSCEFCTYLGIPLEACKPITRADPCE